MGDYMHWERRKVLVIFSHIYMIIVSKEETQNLAEKFTLFKWENCHIYAAMLRKFC